MAYDPMKALQAAGVLQGPLPPDVEKAIANLIQEEVDTLIARKSQLPATVNQVAQWTTPAVSPTAMMSNVGEKCLCGVWSGSGTGGG